MPLLSLDSAAKEKPQGFAADFSGGSSLFHSNQHGFGTKDQVPVSFKMLPQNVTRNGGQEFNAILRVHCRDKGERQLYREKCKEHTARTGTRYETKHKYGIWLEPDRKTWSLLFCFDVDQPSASDLKCWEHHFEGKTTVMLVNPGVRTPFAIWDSNGFAINIGSKLDTERLDKLHCKTDKLRSLETKKKKPGTSKRKRRRPKTSSPQSTSQPALQLSSQNNSNAAPTSPRPHRIRHPPKPHLTFGLSAAQCRKLQQRRRRVWNCITNLV